MDKPQRISRHQIILVGVPDDPIHLNFISYNLILINKLDKKKPQVICSSFDLTSTRFLLDYDKEEIITQLLNKKYSIMSDYFLCIVLNKFVQ